MPVSKVMIYKSKRNSFCFGRVAGCIKFTLDYIYTGYV